MTEKRGSWHLITGVVIGLLIGIALSAWVIPVGYVNTDPSALREEDRQDYRVMIAQAYLAEGDAGRALTRLRLLNEDNPSEILIAQAQQMLADGESETQARALALLAAAVTDPALAVTPLPMSFTLAVVSTIQLTVSETATVVKPTNTPGPTSTPRPTITPLPTAGSPFEKIEQTEICEPLPNLSLLQVIVLDASGQAVPGVRVEVSQAGGGTEAFFTGLYPEVSLGYADYEMLPNVVYALRVGETGQPVSNLSAPMCGTDESGVPTYGSLRLIFRQP